MKDGVYRLTLDNLNYRTSPFFLRNTLYGIGKYDMPVIPRFKATVDDFNNLRLLGYDRVKADEGKHADRMVHFFLYDYKFEKVWTDPTKDIERLRMYRAVLTPDYSVYIQMHRMQQMFNIFRFSPKLNAQLTSTPMDLSLAFQNLLFHFTVYHTISEKANICLKIIFKTR